MRSFSSITAIAYIVLTCPWLCAADGENKRAPNVIVILADDLGWSDTTLYGTTALYKTPHIERLAKRGLTFTNAHSASPLCSPTRASLLTGLSPAHHGITAPNCHLPKVVLNASLGTRAAPNKPSLALESVTRLSTSYQTLPKTLKAAGYETGHFGKWHLGSEPYSPLEHGFDVDVPHWSGPGPAGSYVAPWKFPMFSPITPNEHLEDRMASEAADFMEKNAKKPFFLNYWMFSVHAPFDAKKQLIDEYRGLVDDSQPQRSPVYAAMIASMDDAVGTLLDTIDRLGIADNTIIVFTSDNGGNMYSVVENTFATSNTPLRGGKATMYEGGIRIPQVICWPGKIQAGTYSDVLTNTCDIYPTLLEMLSLQPASGQEFDGTSIVPAFLGKPLLREAIFTFFPHDPPVPDWMPPSVSVHRGDWKLIRLFGCGVHGGDRWKLFNLRNDRGEQSDLANGQPPLVRELDSLITDFLKDTNAVVPLANPAFDPAKYDVSVEGQPQDRHTANPARKREPKTKSLQGWTPSRDCELSSREGSLTLHCLGSDPFITTKLRKPLPPEDLTLEVTAISDASGIGQLFWEFEGVTPAFVAERSKPLAIIHDGKQHVYRIAIEANQPVSGIRIDPARNAGTVTFSSIRLLGQDGIQLELWSFNGKQE